MTDHRCAVPLELGGHEFVDPIQDWARESDGNLHHRFVVAGGSSTGFAHDPYLTSLRITSNHENVIED